MLKLPGSIIFRGDQYPPPSPPRQRSGLEVEQDAAIKPRVLVVDDERLLADTTAAILRHVGFNSKVAYDAFGALEMAASFHPDYLLTDIMMPAMNGVDLAIAITRMFPRTNIVLFSGQAGIGDILKESKARGFEFPLLAKPVHPSKLVDFFKNLKND